MEEKAGISVVKNANILLLAPEQKLPDGTDAILTGVRRKLLAIRSGRTRPFRDEKIIAAWNGLMIWALAKGYQVLDEPRYLRSARKAARDVIARMRDSKGRLLRIASGGGTRGSTGGGAGSGPVRGMVRRGFLTDYAFLIQALLQLYQSDFDPRWIQAAIELQKLQDRLFRDPEGGGYFFSEEGGSPLLQRGKHYDDDALPSGNAVAALNLLQLADLTLQGEWRAHAARVLEAGAGPVRANPAVHSQMLMALDYLLDRSKEVAVIGSLDDPATQEVVRFLQREFLPNKVLAAGKEQAGEQEDESQGNPTPLLLALKPMLHGKTTTYVCEQNICLLPTTELAVVKRLVKKNKPYRLEDSP